MPPQPLPLPLPPPPSLRQLQLQRTPLCVWSKHVQRAGRWWCVSRIWQRSERVRRVRNPAATAGLIAYPSPSSPPPFHCPAPLTALPSPPPTC